jgi:predicted ester cyclase
LIFARKSYGRFEFSGGTMGPFPATGKKMAIVIMGMHPFEGEKVAETWTVWDTVVAMMQLGLFSGA